VGTKDRAHAHGPRRRADPARRRPLTRADAARDAFHRRPRRARCRQRSPCSSAHASAVGRAERPYARAAEIRPPRPRLPAVGRPTWWRRRSDRHAPSDAPATTPARRGHTACPTAPCCSTA
jgi:hypothetical protein